MEHDVVVINSNNECGDAADLAVSSYRLKLAQSMITPIRTPKDYYGIGRKTFIVDPLPDGALPIYDTNPNLVGFDHDEVIISSDNQSGIKDEFNLNFGARRVVFPTFEFFSNPTVKLSDIKARRYDLIDRGGISSFAHDEVIITSDNTSGFADKVANWKSMAINRARQQIMAQEDAAIFAALDAAASGNNDI